MGFSCLGNPAYQQSDCIVWTRNIQGTSWRGQFSRSFNHTWSVPYQDEY